MTAVRAPTLASSAASGVTPLHAADPLDRSGLVLALPLHVRRRHRIVRGPLAREPGDALPFDAHPAEGGPGLLLALPPPSARILARGADVGGLHRGPCRQRPIGSDSTELGRERRAGLPGLEGGGQLVELRRLARLAPATSLIRPRLNDKLYRSRSLRLNPLLSSAAGREATRQVPVMGAAAALERRSPRS